MLDFTGPPPSEPESHKEVRSRLINQHQRVKKAYDDSLTMGFRIFRFKNATTLAFLNSWNKIMVYFANHHLWLLFFMLYLAFVKKWKSKTIMTEATKQSARLQIASLFLHLDPIGISRLLNRPILWLRIIPGTTIIPSYNLPLPNRQSCRRHFLSRLLVNNRITSSSINCYLSPKIQRKFGSGWWYHFFVPYLPPTNSLGYTILPVTAKGWRSRRALKMIRFFHHRWCQARKLSTFIAQGVRRHTDETKEFSKAKSAALYRAGRSKLVALLVWFLCTQQPTTADFNSRLKNTTPLPLPHDLHEVLVVSKSTPVVKCLES